MKLAIITGVSRGLGEATAKLMMKKNFHILGVSRTTNEHLDKEAKKHNLSYTHIACDLGSLTEVNKLCREITNQLSKSQFKKVILVNNAAALEPIDQVMNIKSEDLARHVQVNTVAPMVLMNHCLKVSQAESILFTGVSITSGAAERPIYGWSPYCSTKASINMYTKTAALEQDELNTGNKVIAFSPGVMDTHMQQLIRSSTEQQFVDVEAYRQLKNEDHLLEPTKVGEVLVNILTDENEIHNGKVYYVSDFL